MVQDSARPRPRGRAAGGFRRSSLYLITSEEEDANDPTRAGEGGLFRVGMLAKTNVFAPKGGITICKLRPVAKKGCSIEIIGDRFGQC